MAAHGGPSRGCSASSHRGPASPSLELHLALDPTPAQGAAPSVTWLTPHLTAPWSLLLSQTGPTAQHTATWLPSCPGVTPEASDCNQDADSAAVAGARGKRDSGTAPWETGGPSRRPLPLPSQPEVLRTGRGGLFFLPSSLASFGGLGPCPFVFPASGVLSVRTTPAPSWLTGGGGDSLAPPDRLR